MRVDVIAAILRIVFDDEDRGLAPELAFRNRLDDHADAGVIVGHEGFRRNLSGSRSIGVIVAHAHGDQLGHLVPGLEAAQFLDEGFGAVDVGILEIESTVVGTGHRPENGVANAFDLLTVGSGSLAIGGEVAIIAQRETGFVSVAPEIAGGGPIGNFLAFVIVSALAAVRRSYWARA